MFVFLNLLYLVGLVSIGIPLLVHLSRSRKTKKMRFSTTRFFTDQFLRSYRMSKIREFWLLACRIALFALFAIALAQPLFRRERASSSGGARTVVLVLDNSASMSLQEGGVSLFDRARLAARDILDGLKSGDEVAIILAGRREIGPEVLLEPTDDIDEAKQALDRTQVAALGTDLTNTLERAEQIALSARTPGKEVYVFSDLQDTGWEERRDKGSDSGQVTFIFAAIHPKGEPRNVGITAVQLGAARPMIGVPFTIRPIVAVNDPDVQSVTVRLYVDDPEASGAAKKSRLVGEQKVERLVGGRWAIPRFHHTFTTGGWHHGRVEVDDPHLPLDNTRYFAVEVLDKLSILAVNGAPSAVPRLDELFFLKLALTASPEGEPSPVQVDTVLSGAIPDLDRRRHPLVILANVEQLSDAAVDKLESFAESGGSLLFFLGDRVNSSFYNDTLAADNRRHGGLLPGRLVERQGDPAGTKDIANVGRVRYEHPALSAFEDQRNGSLTGPGIGFRALWRMDVPADAVLMKATNGSPLLVEKEFGRGRVMVFTSTCDRDWTNFPIRPAFLPWLHRLAAHLAQEPTPARTYHQTGDVVHLPLTKLDPERTLVVEKPDGTTGYGNLEIVADTPTLSFSDTVQPGVYRVRTTEKEPVALFAVNLESYESDLACRDDLLAAEDRKGDRTQRIESGLKEMLGRQLVAFIDNAEFVREEAAGVAGSTPLWDVFLVLVLGVALFEPWFANRISLRRYGTSHPTRPAAEVHA